jgi:hypothetical protein
MEKCHRMHVTGCTILDCDNVGVLLKECGYVSYDALMVSDTRPGATSMGLRAVDGSGKVLKEVPLPRDKEAE